MYLLIIGSPRSGTTLFASMISAHSDVAMLIEDKFFSIKKLTGKKILANKLCIPHQIDLSKHANYFSRAAKKIGLLENYPPSDYTINDYLNLPDSKILAIIRNGSDVIASIKKRGKKFEKTAIFRWEKAIDIIYRLQKDHSDRVGVIAYEDLVKKPESIIKSICGFLNIEFQPQMLEGGYKYNILYPGENKIDASKAKNKSSGLENYQFDKSIIDKYSYLQKSSIQA